MMQCDIHRITDKIWQCRTCGKVYLADYIDNTFKPPFNKIEECPGELPHKRNRPPTMSEKIKNYGRAVTKWAKLKFPNRTPEEIEYLLNTFCKNCEEYDSQNKSCNKCGCRVNSSKIPLVNKLAMGSEGCPLGKFHPKMPEKVEVANG